MQNENLMIKVKILQATLEALTGFKKAMRIDKEDLKFMNEEKKQEIKELETVLLSARQY
jgi:hypothetical protein